MTNSRTINSPLQPNNVLFKILSNSENSSNIINLIKPSTAAAVYTFMIKFVWIAIARVWNKNNYYH